VTAVQPHGLARTSSALVLCARGKHWRATTPAVLDLPQCGTPVDHDQVAIALLLFSKGAVSSTNRDRSASGPVTALTVVRGAPKLRG
jgi:hypothetical protein